MKFAAPVLLRGDALRLGWPGIAGAALLAVGAGLSLAVVQPARERAHEARAATVSARERAAAARGAQAPEARTVAQQLRDFHASFPGEREAADCIARIAAIASRSGIVLQQADYRMERDKGARLVRMQMNLPLKGPYPAIRQFLSGVRAELPTASLDQVAFERQKVGDGVVEARIRLVVFLGAAQ